MNKISHYQISSALHFLFFLNLLFSPMINCRLHFSNFKGFKKYQNAYYFKVLEINFFNGTDISFTQYSYKHMIKPLASLHQLLQQFLLLYCSYRYLIHIYLFLLSSISFVRRLRKGYTHRVSLFTSIY